MISSSQRWRESDDEVTLESLFEEHPAEQLHAVKIDVEGSEEWPIAPSPGSGFLIVPLESHKALNVAIFAGHLKLATDATESFTRILSRSESR